MEMMETKTDTNVEVFDSSEAVTEEPVADVVDDAQESTETIGESEWSENQEHTDATVEQETTEPDYKSLYEQQQKQFEQVQMQMMQERMKQLGNPVEFVPPVFNSEKMPEELRMFADTEPEIAQAMQHYVGQYLESWIQHRMQESQRQQQLYNFQLEQIGNARANVGKEFGLDDSFWSDNGLAEWINQNGERYAEIQKNYPIEHWVRTVTKEYLDSKQDAKAKAAANKSAKLSTNQKAAQSSQPSKSSGDAVQKKHESPAMARYREMRKSQGIKHV